MAKKSLGIIVEKQIKYYKVEKVTLWFLIILGTTLMLTGIGVYFYIGKLTIPKEVSTLSTQSFIKDEIRMLYNFSTNRMRDNCFRFRSSKTYTTKS